jgi:hypothetical protein
MRDDLHAEIPYQSTQVTAEMKKCNRISCEEEVCEMVKT